jgi:hypothetical protein
LLRSPAQQLLPGQQLRRSLRPELRRSLREWLRTRLRPELCRSLRQWLRRLCAGRQLLLAVRCHVCL